MNIRMIFASIICLAAPSAQAYVACNNVPVTAVQSTSTSSYHRFNDSGLVGSVVFVAVPATYCQSRNGEELSDVVFMSIDRLGKNNTIAEFWSGLLLTAFTTGRTISFSATYKGAANGNHSILMPYYIRLNPK